MRKGTHLLLVLALQLATNLVVSLDFSAIGYEFKFINVRLQLMSGVFKDDAESRALHGKSVWRKNENEEWEPVKSDIFELTAWKLRGDDKAMGLEFTADASVLHLSDSNLVDHGEKLSSFVLKTWDPLAATNRDTVYTISGSYLKDFQIVAVDDARQYGPKAQATKDIESNAHITSAMSLKGIQRLFRWGQRGQQSILRPKELVHCGGWNKDVYITADNFKRAGVSLGNSAPNDSVLGFLSYMMSIAKSADKLTGLRMIEPKARFYVMNRTSWVKLYAMSGIPAVLGLSSLYDLAQSLSCYKWVSNKLKFDDDYCNIWSRKPEKEFEKTGWQVIISNDRASELKNQGSPLAQLMSSTVTKQGLQTKVTLTVRMFIDGIQTGTDWLSLLDTLYLGQIGAMGDALEPLIDGTTLAGIFEFRTPVTLRVDQFKDYMYIGASEVKKLQGF